MNYIHRYIHRAKLYKAKSGKWIVDVSGEPALLSIMTPHLIRLKEGYTVGRFFHDSWQEAHDFLFEPEKPGQLLDKVEVSVKVEA